MPRATCRCGHKMSLPADGPERIVCPKCSAKIRVRRAPNLAPPPSDSATGGAGDGFLRFACPCGRRLKVKAGSTSAGKCPVCGRIVPVPSSSTSSAIVPTTHPEAPTEELSPNDLAMLDRWAQGRLSRADAASGPPAIKAEAGLRVCPRCGRPVHLGAVACRECGTHVPKR